MPLLLKSEAGLNEITQRQVRTRALRIVLAEASCALIFCLAGLLVEAHWQWLASASLGLVLFVLPNTYFILTAFRSSDAMAGVDFLRGLARGLAGKFMLTCAGFTLAFHFYPNLNAPVLFAGYGAMWLAHLAWVQGAKHLR